MNAAMVRNGVLVLIAAAAASGIVAGVKAFGRSDAPTAPPGLGASVPPIGTDFVMAVLVSVQGDAVTDDNALLYVSRKTFNRLRTEAGGTVECDREGMQMKVLAGPSAQAWSIPAGAAVTLTEVRRGVPVPITIVAGDGWFLTGDSMVSPPCQADGGG